MNKMYKYKKLIITLGSYTPIRLNDGEWTYSFNVLPELSIFWLGGLQDIYFSWLFWSITFQIK